MATPYKINIPMYEGPLDLLLDLIKKQEMSIHDIQISKINIPMYEGPLDLLLDLIKKQEMSIHDIQISKITSQYLDYLHKLEELNVDVSSEFIYMAASLIYID